MLGRQPAIGPDPKLGMPCPSWVRPTAASGDRIICAGPHQLALQVLLRVLGPGREPGQEKSECRASGGAQLAGREILGISRHHNLAVEIGGCRDGGAPHSGRGQRGQAARGGVREETPAATSCVTLDAQLTSLNLSFLITKMGTSVMPVAQAAMSIK